MATLYSCLIVVFTLSADPSSRAEPAPRPLTRLLAYLPPNTESFVFQMISRIFVLDDVDQEEAPRRDCLQIIGTLLTQRLTKFESLDSISPYCYGVGVRDAHLQPADPTNGSGLVTLSQKCEILICERLSDDWMEKLKSRGGKVTKDQASGKEIIDVMSNGEMYVCRLAEDVLALSNNLSYISDVAACSAGSKENAVKSWIDDSSVKTALSLSRVNSKAFLLSRYDTGRSPTSFLSLRAPNYLMEKDDKAMFVAIDFVNEKDFGVFVLRYCSGNRPGSNMLQKQFKNIFKSKIGDAGIVHRDTNSVDYIQSVVMDLNLFEDPVGSFYGIMAYLSACSDPL